MNDVTWELMLQQWQMRMSAPNEYECELYRDAEALKGAEVELSRHNATATWVIMALINVGPA